MNSDNMIAAKSHQGREPFTLPPLILEDKFHYSKTMAGGSIEASSPLDYAIIAAKVSTPQILFRLKILK
jgi:hypothetical protein